jgi:hypothetical protein
MEMSVHLCGAIVRGVVVCVGRLLWHHHFVNPDTSILEDPMRKQSKWRRVVVAALIGVGLALVGGGFAFMSPDDGSWTADGSWTQSVSIAPDSPIVTDGPVMTPLDGSWTL